MDPDTVSKSERFSDQRSERDPFRTEAVKVKDRDKGLLLLDPAQTQRLPQGRQDLGIEVRGDTNALAEEPRSERGHFGSDEDQLSGHRRV